jgi:branched-chain amino acid transport system substrate-binding protein
VHKRSPRYVFQSAQPFNAYGAGALQVAKEGGYRQVALLARDDPAALEMAQGARESALQLGLAPGEVMVYKGGTRDFEPQVAKARAAQAEAWIAFGQVNDAAEMVKTFRRLDYAPKLFFALRAADPKLIPQIGQDAEFTLAGLEYDTRFATPGNDKFVKAYAAKWSARPGLSAAEGYAAATVLAEGFRRAGSADQQKLRAALASLATSTVLGEFKVDPETGEQTASKPALAQILLARPEIVWPPGLATVKRVLPYPQWSERRPIK